MIEIVLRETYIYICIVEFSTCDRWEFESHSGEVYSIQHYAIKFFKDLRQVGGFLRILRFPPPIKLPRYNWNIVECGVKHHNPTLLQFVMDRHKIFTSVVMISRCSLFQMCNTIWMCERLDCTKCRQKRMQTVQHFKFRLFALYLLLLLPRRQLQCTSSSELTIRETIKEYDRT